MHKTQLTTPGESGPGNNGNEVVFQILQISSTGASASDAI